MDIDPRHRNVIFDATSLASYMAEYSSKLRDVIMGIDPQQVQKAADLILRTSVSGNKIYVAGNGGSAAIAEHLCCDWTKGTQCDGHPTIDTRSLTSNVALYSAIANDFGFEQVFSKQIEFSGRSGDLLIAISSSGNSANIVYAADLARQRGMSVIGFTGFGGGKLLQRVDVSIHADVANYGIVEDAHQAVVHIIAQFIAQMRDSAQKTL